MNWRKVESRFGHSLTRVPDVIRKVAGLSESGVPDTRIPATNKACPISSSILAHTCVLRADGDAGLGESGDDFALTSASCFTSPVKRDRGNCYSAFTDSDDGNDSGWIGTGELSLNGVDRMFLHRPIDPACHTSTGQSPVTSFF